MKGGRKEGKKTRTISWCILNLLSQFLPCPCPLSWHQIYFFIFVLRTNQIMSASGPLPSIGLFFKISSIHSLPGLVLNQSMVFA